MSQSEYIVIAIIVGFFVAALVFFITTSFVEFLIDGYLRSNGWTRTTIEKPSSVKTGDTINVHRYHNEELKFKDETVGSALWIHIQHR